MLEDFPSEEDVFEMYLILVAHLIHVLKIIKSKWYSEEGNRHTTK